MDELTPYLAKPDMVAGQGLGMAAAAAAMMFGAPPIRHRTQAQKVKPSPVKLTKRKKQAEQKQARKTQRRCK